MMLQIGDDGVVSTVDEDDLIYVDKNELDELVDRYNCLKEENEQLKQHQRTLEAKIVRLKDRVKTFEKNYSLKDIERYKKMENCNCITSKRLEE